MVVSVKWNFNLFVDGSQSVTLSDSFKTDAFDKISVAIPKKKKNDEPIEVQVQPSEIEKIDFLCIKTASDQYDENLVYTVGDGEKALTLNRAHVLIGSSLVSLLGEAPKTLKFSNTSENDVDIEIIIGRRAKT